MALSVRETPDRFIVTFTDKRIVDVSRIEEIGKSLLEICQRASKAAKRLVIDFSEVQFLPSAMLNKLMLINNFAKQHSVDLRLGNLRPEVIEVLRITHLDKLFRLDDDGPDLLGAPVPLSKPPGQGDGHSEPPKS